MNIKETIDQLQDLIDDRKSLIQSSSDYYYEIYSKDIKALEKAIKLMKEHKEILTNEEKDIIRTLVKYHYTKIISIQKSTSKYYNNAIYIYIMDINNMLNVIYFKDTLFKGMEVNKRYTIEELGL